MPGTDQRRSSARASSRCHPESTTRSQAEASSVERVYRSRVIVSDWLAGTDDQGPRKSGSRLTKGGHDSSTRDRGAHRRSESGRQLVSTASAVRTSAGTLLTHQGFQLQVSSHCRTPYLQDGSRGRALLASDGSVLQLGPTRHARAPLRRLPPAEVPYIINSLGAPYGMCDSGELLPLAVSSRGELWCGPDGHPLMLRPSPQHATPAESPIMQLIMASGSPMWLSTGGRVGLRVRRDVALSPVAPAVAVALVDLTSGQDLVDSQTGQRLKVDPASLELLGPGGRPAYDQRGRPLRLVGTEPQAQHHPVHQALPLRPSVGLLAACVLVLVVVAVLVKLAAACGCLGTLVTLLLVAVAWGALAGLAACRPTAVPLPHPVLLNVRGRPLRDARGQRLCLTGPDAAGQRHVVTDTGDMVCVSVDSSAGQPAKLVKSLPFLRGGGSAHDVLVDAEGRPLLGRQGAVLRILQDAHQQPHTSPLGLPLALTLTGNPCLGPDGAPLALTPDGKVLLGCQGQPLLGPAGRMLVLGAQGDLRYLKGPALRGPSKQRVYLCASGALSHALGTPALSAAGAGLSLATCPALISSSGGVLAGPGGTPVTRGPWGTLLTYSSRVAWWLWPLEWEATPVERSHRNSNTANSRSHSGLLLSGSGRVRIRRSGAASSSRRAAPTVLAYAGSMTATMAGSSSAAGTLQDAATAMPRVSSRLRLSSTTNTAATNRTAARLAGASAATSASGHVMYIPINGAGVALLNSTATTPATSCGSSSSTGPPDVTSPPADMEVKVTPEPGEEVAAPQPAVAASGAGAVDAAAAVSPSSPSQRATETLQCSPWQAASQQLVVALDWVLVLLQLVILQYPQLAAYTQACLVAGRRCVSWLYNPWAMLQQTWRTAALGIARDMAHLLAAPWSTQLQSLVKQGTALTAGLLVVSYALVVAYPHQQYVQAGMAGLSRPATGGTGLVPLVSSSVQGSPGVGSTPFLHLRLIGAAASAGLLDRAVTRRECLQLQVLGMGPPQECSQGRAHAALVQLLGVAPPAGYPTTLLSAVAHWCLWVWPVPQVALLASLLTLLCAWVMCSSSKRALAAAPGVTPSSSSPVRVAARNRRSTHSSSWTTWVVAGLVVAAAVWASSSCGMLAGGSLGVSSTKGHLQAAHQRHQAAAIQAYLTVVQQVAGGQQDLASAGGHPGSLEGLEHLLLPTPAAMDPPEDSSRPDTAMQQQQSTGGWQAAQLATPEHPPWGWTEPGAAEGMEAQEWLEATQDWYMMDAESSNNNNSDGDEAVAGGEWPSSTDMPSTLLYQLLLVVGGWLQLVPVVVVVLLVAGRGILLLAAPAKPQLRAASGLAWSEGQGSATSRTPSGKEPSFTKWLKTAAAQDPVVTLPCIPEEMQPGLNPSWQVPACQAPPSGQPPSSWEVASRTSEPDWSVVVEPAAEGGLGKERRLSPSLGPTSSEGDTTSGSSGSRSSRASGARPLTLHTKDPTRGYPRRSSVVA